MPKLSIVIPAFNEEKLLPRTLASVGTAVEALRERGWDWELIVCDNNSRDRTAEVAREHGARVVFEPVNQIARARNTGAGAATGEWILFLDADSVASRELIGAAMDEVGRGNVILVGAVVQLDGDLPRWGRVFLSLWNLLSRTLRWVAGSFVLVEATAFREVGGFDLGLYAGEELELSRRVKAVARRRGCRCAIVSNPPLVSSARRMKLYSRGEILRFTARAMLRPLATPRSREACGMWYDGRR